MSAGLNLVMTLVGFTMSIMFMVFICTRLICARIHFIASRSSFPVASRSNLNTLGNGLHGLEPIVIANFPIKKCTNACFSATEDARCTVCLSEYHANDILRVLPTCGHFFHVTCIDIWLQHHSTCPVCRISLCEFSEKKRLMKPFFSSAIGSHFRTEFFSRGNDFPSRNDSRRMDRNLENNGGDGLEAGENISPATEDDETGIEDLRNKLVESPSNP